MIVCDKCRRPADRVLATNNTLVVWFGDAISVFAAVVADEPDEYEPQLCPPCAARLPAVIRAWCERGPDGGDQ